MGEQEDWKNEQDREDDRAYALIMKTLESSLGYRLVWGIGPAWVAHCDAAARRPQISGALPEHGPMAALDGAR
jgi:hypothetical protein